MIFILIALLILWGATIIICYGTGFSSISTYKTVGRVEIHTEELVPRSKITEFLVDKNLIYILYDDVGIVNVYSVDGNFMYGIQIDTISNSHGDIAIADNRLLVKSRSPVIYVFNGTQLEHYVTGYHSDFVNNTDSYKEYKVLSQYFSEPKCHSYGDRRYILSDTKTELLVSTSSGLYVAVDFLPQHSEYAKTSWVLLALLIILFCELSRRVPHK